MGDDFQGALIFLKSRDSVVFVAISKETDAL